MTDPIIQAQALAWQSVVTSYECGDALQVMATVEREIERLFTLVQQREDAREELRRLQHQFE